METWGVNTLLMCFGGGIMGAAFGGLFSFVLCGLILLAGCIQALCGGGDFVLLQIGLGPIWGPHVGGFTSGLVAASYAAGIKKNHPGGSAKDILSPMMDTSWDVLLVGGVTALLGHGLLQVLGQIPFVKMFDCIALVVIIIPLIARLLFLKEMPFGSGESIKKHGLFGTDNYAISWCPWNARPGRMVMLGLGAGLLSGGMAMGIKVAIAPMVLKGTISGTDAFVVPLVLCFSLAAIMLIGVNFGTGTIQKFPIWHSMAILSAMAYLRFDSLIVAAIVGVVSIFVQEFMARLFYNHGSNHIDPPACTTAVGTLVINVVMLAVK